MKNGFPNCYNHTLLGKSIYTNFCMTNVVFCRIYVRIFLITVEAKVSADVF